MDAKVEEMSINGVTYVRKDTVNTPAQKVNGLPYVIIRGDRSGLFAGYLQNRDGREVILLNARRLWYWDGAASASQLAISGVSKPQNCKFPAEVSKIQILDAIEILNCTEKARLSIAEVKVWVA